MCPKNRFLQDRRVPARAVRPQGSTRLPDFPRKRVCEALVGALLLLEAPMAFATYYTCSSDVLNSTISQASSSIGTLMNVFYSNGPCGELPSSVDFSTMGQVYLNNTGKSEELPTSDITLYFENPGAGDSYMLGMTGGAPELDMSGHTITYSTDNVNQVSSYTGQVIVYATSSWDVGAATNTDIRTGVNYEPATTSALGNSVVLDNSSIPAGNAGNPTLGLGYQGFSSYAGTITVDLNYGTLDLVSGGTFALSSNIVGATGTGNYEGIEVSGGGTLDYSGIMSLTQPLLIDSGVTLVPGQQTSIYAPSSVVVNSNATLSVPNAGVVEIQSLAGAGTVNLSAGSLDVVAGSTTFSGTVTGAGGFEVAGGTQTFSGTNTYTGDTLINSYAGLDITGTGSLADSRVNTPGGLFISGATNGTSIRSLTGSSIGIVVLGSQTLTLANAADTFPGVISGVGGGLTVAAGTETLTGANTYTGATTVAAGATLELSGTGSVAGSVVSANGDFDISATSAGATIPGLAGASGGVVNLGGQNLTLSNPAATFNGVIQGSGGSLTLLAGTETLTGASTYTGDTTIDAGAALDLTGTSSLVNTRIVTPGGLFISGTSQGATVRSLSGAAPGIVVLGSQTLTLDNAADTFGGVISGVGGGLNVAAGTETLSGANTYTGATTVAAGATLDLSGAGSVAGSAVTANGNFDISATSGGSSIQSLAGGGAGAVNLGAQNLSLSNAVDTFNGSIAGSGSLTVAGGTETLTGNNGYTGATTIDGGANLVLTGTGSIASSAVGDSGTLDISGVFSRATIVSLSGSSGGVVNLGGSDLALKQASGSFGGILQGSNGSLTIEGGTETLTGANTYTGATTIASGATLALGGAGSVASSSDILANGILDLSAATTGQSITTLSGASTGEVLIGNQTLTLSNASTTFSGSIAGTGGGLYIAAGRQTLAGSSSYTGSTTIASGATLALAGRGPRWR